LIGDYTVELSLAGYATAYEKVTIIEGQTAEVNATLQNGMQVEIASVQGRFYLQLYLVMLQIVLQVEICNMVIKK
jgi:hypothetical protein